MSRVASVDIEQLTRDERLDLLERLWESLSEDPEGIPLTDEQRAELENRLDRLDREGPTGIPWEQIRDGDFRTSSCSVTTTKRTSQWQ